MRYLETINYLEVKRYPEIVISIVEMAEIMRY